MYTKEDLEYFINNSFKLKQNRKVISFYETKYHIHVNIENIMYKHTYSKVEVLKYLRNNKLSKLI